LVRRLDREERGGGCLGRVRDVTGGEADGLEDIASFYLGKDLIIKDCTLPQSRVYDTHEQLSRTWLRCLEEGVPTDDTIGSYTCLFWIGMNCSNAALHHPIILNLQDLEAVFVSFITSKPTTPAPRYNDPILPVVNADILPTYAKRFPTNFRTR